MKNKGRFIVFLIFSLLIFSCKKDFLIKPPATSIVRETYITNLTSCNDFLNGAYIDLSSKFFHRYFLVYPELIADNVKPVSTSTAFMPHYLWSQLADETSSPTSSASALNMNGIWNAGYKVILSANFILENVEKFREENSTLADNIKGQALALRALVYSYLINVFSQPYNFTPDASHDGIPFVTSSDFLNTKSRQSVAQVYENIINDLQNAIKVLPNSGISNVFINLNAAKALLARVYLFKGDYNSAKNLARDITNQVPLMVGVNYPSKLFTPQETEALFQLPPYTTGYATSFPSYVYRGSIQFLATEDIASILNDNPGDKRKVWVSLNSGNWNIVKYPLSAVTGIATPSEAYYQTIIRSSEMFLTASEAYAKINNDDSARFFLNAIRQRANLSALSTVAGSQLLDSIYKERRRELCFEGLRSFDLQRLGQSIVRKDALNASAKNLPYPSFKAISPINAYDVRYYGISQNPTY